MVMEEKLEKVLESYEPGSEVKSVKDVSGHANDTFIVELEDEKVVCTLCTHENPQKSCRKEVLINEEIGEKTQIPVPEILFTNCSFEPPFYITRRVEGDNCQDVLENRVKKSKRLNQSQKKELFRRIGNIIGELHSAFQFATAGNILVEGEGLEVENGSPLREYLLEKLNQESEDLKSTRYSDMLEEIEDLVPKLVDRLGNYENVLVHRDIRPDNLVIEGTEIKALFDFEEAISCHPAFDYAYAEKHLVYPHRYFDNISKPSREEIKELKKALEDGYKSKMDVGKDWRQQVEIFKLAEMIEGMNTFEWYADTVGWSEEKREEDEKQTKEIFRRKKANLGL